MLPQFIDEDPRVLAVVYGDRDQLHAALLKSPLERRHQPLGGLDPGAARVMSARERDEIRISECHAEVGKAVGVLFPADHALSIVLQDQHHKILEAHCCFQLLGIHHEAAVAADRKHLSSRMEQRSHNPRRQARAHRGQRVVEQESVRNLCAIIASEPDLVHAIVEADDAVIKHHLPHIVHDALRRERVESTFRPIRSPKGDPKINERFRCCKYCK
jgi:hypothetical protein